MDFRNKLGVFTFDDDLSPTLVQLVAATVMGQYFSPKPGEPDLHNEQSCYDFIRERCGNVLCAVGFELTIRDEVRKTDFNAQMEAEIKMLQRVRDERIAANILANQERVVNKLKAAFPGSWLVGPASLAPQ